MLSQDLQEIGHQVTIISFILTVANLISRSLCVETCSLHVMWLYFIVFLEKVQSIIYLKRRSFYLLLRVTCQCSVYLSLVLLVTRCSYCFYFFLDCNYHCCCVCVFTEFPTLSQFALPFSFSIVYSQFSFCARPRPCFGA